MSFISLTDIKAQLDVNKYLKQIDTMSISKDKVKAYLDISWEYYLIENDSSLFFSEKAYKLALENNDSFGQVISLESMGIYHESVYLDYEKAISLYIEAIEISEKNKLNYSDSLYMSLGIIFQETRDYETAAKYFKKTINISEKKNEKGTLSYALVNYGIVLKNLNKIELAKESFLKCLSIEKPASEIDLSCYSNIAEIYDDQKEYEKAHFYHKKSLEFPLGEKITIRYLPNYIGALENNLLREDSDGLDSLVTKIYSFANNATSLMHKANAFESLSKAHLFKREYEKAIYTAHKAKKLSDSLYEIKIKKTTYELERKYESQKTREALKEEKIKKQSYILGLIILLLFFFILSYLFYKRYKTNKLLSSQKVLLEKSIDEKNVLLKETHHRVKNSFQIVSSLLYLQSESIQDKEAKIAVKEAENRVRSMVLIHQKLYNKDELVGINTKEYITDLVTDIFESHQEKSNLMYELNIESLVLDIETITPIGLILNELIVNTLKHAYDVVTPESKIKISFKREANNLVLKIIDNGKGFSGEIKNTSFGITLMKALSKKLDAVLSYTSKINEGTEASLLIKKFKVL